MSLANITSSKLVGGIIAFIICTGWLAFLGAIGYGLVSDKLTFSALFGAASSIITLLATALGAGGVHFIYQRNNGHSVPPAAGS